MRPFTNPDTQQGTTTSYGRNTNTATLNLIGRSKSQVLEGHLGYTNYIEFFDSSVFKHKRDDYWLLMDDYNRRARRGKRKRIKRKWLLVHKQHPNLEKLTALLQAERVDPLPQLRRLGAKLK